MKKKWSKKRLQQKQIADLEFGGAASVGSGSYLSLVVITGTWEASRE